jgi:hypothetical protein
VKEERTKLPEGKEMFSSWRQMFHDGQPTHDIDHITSVVVEIKLFFVATFQQHQHMGFTSLNSFAILELVVDTTTSLRDPSS